MNSEGGVAYFSMEIGLEAGIKTYSGGLGVLAATRFAPLPTLECR